MTAEIAILNRQGIALAADSAVTIGKDRVWKTANKLFSLGPAHDIGIMMHGSADYLGFSWETIIKMFRRYVQSKRYKTVAECASDLNDFVLSDRFRHNDLEAISIASIYLHILEEMKTTLTFSSKMDFRVKLCEYVLRHIEIIEGSDLRIFLNDLGITAFRQEWAAQIKLLASDTFGQVITAKVLTHLTKLMYELTIRQSESPFSTGLVVAGFGEDEPLPVLYNYTYDGRSGDLCRTWIDRHRDLNDGGIGSAFILPFGQGDMVYTVMEGINKNYLTFIEELLGRVLARRGEELVNHIIADDDARLVELTLLARENEAVIQEFHEEFRKYRRAALVDPVIKALTALPREEMAEMARAMIDITSLRRKVESVVQSVGGPVDVAVISKGDGFIWINRKHYFDVETNQDFLYRKYGTRRLLHAEQSE